MDQKEQKALNIRGPRKRNTNPGEFPLYDLRIQRNLTQAQVADSVGITSQSYYYYERGEREMGYENLKKVADYFDVSIDFILGRETALVPFSQRTAPQSVHVESCIALFNKMSEMQQIHTLGFMAGLLESGRNGAVPATY